MKKMSILGILGLLLTVLAAPVQAAVEENTSFDVLLSAFVPCANGGAGEIVDLEGPLHVLVSFTINNNHVNGNSHFQPQGISGTGETTGDTYHAVGVTQDHFEGSLVNGQFNENFVNNFRIVGQGPGNNFSIHENFHITINANGELTSFHDNFVVDCK
jgi:hypothetical protein